MSRTYVDKGPSRSEAAGFYEPKPATEFGLILTHWSNTMAPRMPHLSAEDNDRVGLAEPDSAA